MQALQQATRTVPIVFTSVLDPVGAGYVGSLARPGGNATGFTLFECGVSAKWLELLKEIAAANVRVLPGARIRPDQQSKAAADKVAAWLNGRDRKSTRLNSSHLGISY